MKNMVLVGLILEIILLVWAIFDIVKYKPKNSILWIILCFVLPVIGPILYFQLKYWRR
ncbi:MAG: PLDc N-terminal domain-containing protein [Bacteroidales bacterium]|nr:PLDc N-terminal domain-containing protein [Bacteroidales bacterium]